MRTKGAKQPSPPSEGNTIPVHQVESPNYRTFHVDGATGLWTPTVNLFIGFYVERVNLKEDSFLQFKPGGPAEHVRELQQLEIIREIEAGIIMSYPTAKNFALWLNQRLEELEDSAPKKSGETTPQKRNNG